jgi:hypothetical protein
MKLNRSARPSPKGPLHETSEERLSAGIQYAAGRYSDLATLRLAHERGLVLGKRVSEGALEARSMPKLQWLSEHGCRWDADNCIPLVDEGELELLQQLEELNFRCDYDDHNLAQAAAATKNLPLIQWLHRNKELDIVNNPYILINAIYSGSIPMVEYLHSEGAPLNRWGEGLCTAAVERDQLEVLQWLADHDSPMHEMEHIAVLCARFDSLRILQHLFANFAEHIMEDIPTYLLHSAGVYGHLRIVQWLREQGAVWPEVLRSESGHQWVGETLVWMREQGCTAPILA